MAIATTRFDYQDFLRTPEDRAAALAVLFEDNPTAGAVAHLLGEIARAHGMSELARTTALSREGLRKALSSDGNPRLSTLMAVLAAFDLRLAIAPIVAAEADEAHPHAEAA